MSMTRCIDVHHHIFTPEYIEELARVGIGAAGGLPLASMAQWQPEASLSVMDRFGIDTALLSVSSPGLCFGNPARERTMARSLNEFAADCVTRWPERFGFFAALPLPDVDATLAEIAYALDTLHADGVGLLSNYAGIYPGDPHLDAIFAELDRRAAVIHLHPTIFTGDKLPTGKNAGSPLPNVEGSVLEFVFDTTRVVANLIFSGTLKKYPRMRIILSHAGGAVPLFAERLLDRSEILTFMQKVQTGQIAPPSPETIAQLMQSGLNSTFSQLHNLYYDSALSTNNTVLSALQRLVPASQILFGSDFPPAQDVGVHYAVQGLAAYTGFSEQERQDIASNNALKLFPRLQASQLR